MAQEVGRPEQGAASGSAELSLFSPAELTKNYSRAGKSKAEKVFGKLITTAFLAGLFIAFGAAVSSTAVHSISNVSVARILSGLLFPFGLGIVMLTGAELFTGNTMICISVLDKKTTLAKMFRNWALVYTGNFAGAILLAAGTVYFGQLNYSHGGLAVYTIKMAAAKCAMPFQNAFVMGILCNILVCTGVLCSLSAKDASGRIFGAYIPVAFFVICGFEHCIANMYYVPAGLFAAGVPSYAAQAAKAGIDIAGLTWRHFLMGNLLPVTLGNICGGVTIGIAMWYINLRKRPSTVPFGTAQEKRRTAH